MQHLTDKGQLSSDAVIGLTKFILQTRGERSKEAVALQQKLQDVKEQFEFAKRQLAEKSVGIARTERVAIITVDKANDAVGTIRLNYLVDAVNWRPQYKLRANKANEPVMLEYLAAVHQQTGEDWANVSLSLSTAQPLLHAAPPDLRMLEVSAVPVGQGRQPVPANPAANRFDEFKKQAGSGRAQGQALQYEGNWVLADKAFNDAAACEQQGELLASRDEIIARSTARWP